MRCKAKIEAGICGFVTEVTAEAPDDQMVSLAIKSDCEKITALGEALKDKEIDGYAEIGAGSKGVILTEACNHLSGCCAGCAVPVGIFKAMQVAARVALPKEVKIFLESE